MTPLDDETLQTLLGDIGPALSDDGFTAAVMQRLQCDQAQHHAPTLDAATALRSVEQQAVLGQRERRWRWAGLAAGVALALPAAASAPLDPTALQSLALLAGLFAGVWGLLAAHAPR